MDAIKKTRLTEGCTWIRETTIDKGIEIITHYLSPCKESDLSMMVETDRIHSRLKILTDLDWRKKLNFENEEIKSYFFELRHKYGIDKDWKAYYGYYLNEFNQIIGE